MSVVVTPGGAPEAPTGAPSDPWTPVWRWASLVALALVVVLAATGVILHRTYRPTPTQSWEAVASLAEDGAPGEQVARRVHRAVSQLLIPVAIAVAVGGVGAIRTR